MTAHLPLPSTARQPGRQRKLRVRWHPLAWAVACAVAPAWAAQKDVRLPEMQSGTDAVKGTGSYAVDAAKALGTVTQTSKRAIYHWKSFDIGRDATMNFDMKAGPGSSALNRVLGSARPSEILGKLKANGNVFLINPNGVLFGSTAQVNVQGLMASTLGLADDVFLNDLNTINTQDATFAWQDVKGE
ncbi:MAG TPA: filamentous hemagglutinin N-terminal domain-containing protein, partial [Aquabacterium sp.]|uniref:two-partner secretion domain-containing protein n=1 Tax=Aquabacterium sp. TaxID=1872578 RepID=UPI002E37262E